MLPADISPEIFLRDYWQKKPLLIRAALPDFSDPVSPEELAGLACEEDVESRLVFHRSARWEMRQGPFQEEDFTSLPDRDWTLMVQSVEHWLPELKQLFSPVDFLPGWRLDDLLVSYATTGAGAGPHFDYYDVFIIQGQGSRTWQLGQQCDSNTALDTSSGMKIVTDFSASDSIELHTGDMLYIPPGLAHEGVSLDESLSYSIGFRAPSLADMLIGFSDEAASALPEDQRYIDPPGLLADKGEISAAVADQLQNKLRELAEDRDALLKWFGQHMTEPRYPGLLPAPEAIITEATLLSLLQEGELCLNPASRLAWHRSGSTLQLFCDGEYYALTLAPAAEQLLLALSTAQQGAAQAEQPYLLDWSACGGPALADNSELKSVLMALYATGAILPQDTLDY